MEQILWCLHINEWSPGKKKKNSKGRKYLHFVHLHLNKQLSHLGHLNKTEDGVSATGRLSVCVGTCFNSTLQPVEIRKVFITGNLVRKQKYTMQKNSTRSEYNRSLPRKRDCLFYMSDAISMRPM